MKDRSPAAKFLLLAISSIALVSTAAASQLDGGYDCGTQSETLDVPVHFTGNGSVVALQFDLQYDPIWVEPHVPIAGDAVVDHLLDWVVVASGVLRVVIHSPTNAAIADGIVAVVPMTVLPAAQQDVLLPLPTHGDQYDGPGAILATLGAVSTLPDVEPEPGQIELVVLTHPVDQATCIGGTASFMASATGAGPTTYQWLHNDVPVPGAVSSTLTVDPVESAIAGSYRCDISNACGQFVTDAATLQPAGVCAPLGLAAFDPGTGAELLTRWFPIPASEIDNYRLYRGENEGGPYTDFEDVGVTGRSPVEGLTDGTRYYFRVSAWVGGSESPFSNESSAVPTSGAFELPESNEYGYQTPLTYDTGHPDAVTYRFPARAGDVTLWYDAYDVDAQGEVSLNVNGQWVIDPTATGSSNWGGSKTVTMPDAMVHDSEPNVLTFDNNHSPPAFETWGVRRVSVKLPAPAVSAQPWSQTVDVTIHQTPLEPSLAGYDVFRDAVPGFWPSAGNLIASGVPGSLYRDDSGLVNGETYYYVVRPMDTISNPGFDSVEVSATPSNAAVTPVMDLETAAPGAGDTQLTWSPVITEAGVQHYEVYEGTDPSALVLTAVTEETEHTLSSQPSAGEVLFYSVLVVDNDDSVSGR